VITGIKVIKKTGFLPAQERHYIENVVTPQIFEIDADILKIISIAVNI